ncbi:MAG TPA: hypothetical protein VKM55_07275 [Candidatus Lokiarchaeia archaeon]|nr:hypothetical protein [Candidatus Lokiarchaeia archaeon]
MTKSCNECGFLLSSHQPVAGDNKLLICEECLRIVCAKCAKKKGNRCPNKNCKSKKLRELTLEEID